MPEIHVSRLHFPVTTLGPGRRIGVWFQGCSIRCKGCISVDTWQHGIGKTSIVEVIQRVRSWKEFADGITITGGEPFDQPSALVELLQQLGRERIGDVLVYTGYAKSRVQGTLDVVDGLIDALISEPFEHRSPDTLPLRGSDNQVLHFLTDKGRRVFARYEDPSDDTTFDAMFDEGGTVWLCGIPKRHDLKRLKLLLQSRGHHVVFTEQNVEAHD